MKGFLTHVDLDQLYEESIRPLSDAEQLRLVERIAEGLARHLEGRMEVGSHHGEPKGPENAAGVDAKDYVEELRNDWDQHTSNPR